MWNDNKATERFSRKSGFCTADNTIVHRELIFFFLLNVPSVELFSVFHRGTPDATFGLKEHSNLKLRVKKTRQIPFVLFGPFFIM